MKRYVISENRDYYVATSGSDAANGSSATPWATLQHAYDWIQKNLDLYSCDVFVNAAPETFNAGLMARGPLVGQIKPSSLTFRSTAAVVSTVSSCFTAVYGAMFRVEGFKVTSSHSGFVSDGNSFIELGAAIELSHCNWAHIHAVAGGRVSRYGVTYQITGGAPYGFLAEGGGKIYDLDSVGNFQNAGVGYGYFAYSNQGGLIDFTGTTFAGSSATATGQKFLVESNATISVNGNSTYYLPGSTPGLATSGGWYG